MQTCTWAPTVFATMQLGPDFPSARAAPRGPALVRFLADYAANIERLGIGHLLVAQRWWGSGVEMEGSSHDCLAMTALLGQLTTNTKLITAIHPGFFSPTVIAKWGATMDGITDGRWAINLTTGWHMGEFDMYGVDTLTHDERYARSSEFIAVLRGAWSGEPFDFEGRYYRARGLRLEPRPAAPLTVYQGGQSDAAIAMAAAHSDWMFVNGAPPERAAAMIARSRAACAATGRTVRFAMNVTPLVRESDEAAWAEIAARLAALDPARVEARRAALRSNQKGGAEGMWATDDDLGMLDSNEGYAARLIGSPDTVLARIRELQSIGVDMLHLTLADPTFTNEVLPRVHAL